MTVARARERARRVAPMSILLASISVGAALRAWAAVENDGVYVPDEIYQSVEPAHRLVFGYGLVAWEFIEGARSWIFPGLIAGALRVFAWFGLDTSPDYVVAVRLSFAALGVMTCCGCAALARALGASRMTAALAAALFSLMGLAVYFAPRALSESAAAAPVVFGLALVLHGDGSRKRLVIGAALLGVSACLRLPCAIFCAGSLIVLKGRNRGRAALCASGVFLSCALVYGLIDFLTWGRFFHSAITYLQFNLVEGKASLFGTEPMSYYARVLYRTLGPMCLLLLPLAALGARRSPGTAGILLAFYLAHALTPHKELRFLVPLLAPLCALAGLGVQELARWRPSAGRAATAVALVLAISSAAALPRLTLRAMGHEGPPDSSALERAAPENRLLAAAGRRADLCGIMLLSEDRIWSGAYFYLHKNAPLYQRPDPDVPRAERPESALEAGHYNYVIALAGQHEGHVVAEDSGRVLARVGSTCRRDPSYDYVLNGRPGSP